MYYLICMPIILLAVIVKLIADRAELKILSFICKIVIILGVIMFIYLYLDYNGINLINMLK